MDLRWLFLSTAFVVSIEGLFVLSSVDCVSVNMHGIMCFQLCSQYSQCQWYRPRGGIDAVFGCRYSGAQAYNWGFNGEFPTYYNYPPDVTVTPLYGDTPATLTIPATAQYKNTVVQCEALVRDGGVFIPKLSVNATLQVQGSHNH